MRPLLTERGGPSDIELRYFLSSFPFSPSVWFSLPYMQIHAGNNGHLLAREVILMKFVGAGEKKRKRKLLEQPNRCQKTVRINL